MSKKISENKGRARKKKVPKLPTNLRIVTWNVKGLDKRLLQSKAFTIAKVLKEHKADIVFIQEAVYDSGLFLELNLGRYKCIRGLDEGGLTTIVFLQNQIVQYDSHYVTRYQHTQTGKNMLIVEAHVGDIELKLINTQLEYGRRNSEQRVNQFKIAVNRCLNFDSGCTVLLAGDFNLHDFDNEDPHGLCDTWIECGSKQEYKYTYDPVKNHNDTRFPAKKPRLRSDRVYMRFSEDSQVKPVEFQLIGCKKVHDSELYPSSHWGVLVTCTLDHSAPEINLK